MIPIRPALVVCLMFSASGELRAQKKNEPKDRPQLTFAEPFFVEAGKTTKLKVRGLKLEGVAEVRCHEPKSRAKLIKHAVKVNVPNPMQLNSHGDLQIEIELALPIEMGNGEVSISAVTPGGESSPLRLLVVDGRHLEREKEPNNGFQSALPLAFEASMEGAIQSPQDVDVFAFEAKAGQRLRFTAFAGRYGSPCEPMLTLFDANGRTILASDDVGRGANAILDAVVSRDGRYYLAVMDAHDQGGGFYRYLLRVESRLGLK